MKLDDPLPGGVAVFTRLVAYGVAAVIIYFIVIGYANFSLMQRIESCAGHGIQRSAMDRSRELATCIASTGSPLERYVARHDLEAVMAPVSTPCNYVGAWSSTRPGMHYRVILRPDGGFIASPIITSGIPHATGSGQWGVHDGRMLWFHDQGVLWPPDINRIVPKDADHFALIERNGALTQYERASDARAPVCPATIAR